MGTPSPVRTSRLTPAQRSMHASIAALSLHASRDSRTVTAPARAAFLATFEHQVDPAGVLPPAERARRAALARRAHFTRLAFASSVARSKNPVTEDTTSVLLTDAMDDLLVACRDH